LGVPSHFWAEIVGGTVSPASLVRKTNLAAGFSGCDDGLPGWDATRHQAH
jgi:hypothetical protein